MTQFIFGMLAGVVVGLVMEWVIDWAGLLPKKSPRDNQSKASAQRSSGSKTKRTESAPLPQTAVAQSSSRPESSEE